MRKMITKIFIIKALIIIQLIILTIPVEGRVIDMRKLGWLSYPINTVIDSINNATVMDTVRCVGINIYGRFSFTDELKSDTIRPLLDFSSSTFDTDTPVDFQGITFNRDVLFDSTTFGCGANFKGAIFLERAVFRKSNFTSSFYLGNITWTDKTDFSDAIFLSKADFDSVCFSGDILFDNAKFNKGVTFKNAIFNKSSSYDGTFFINQLSFENSNLKERLDLRFSNLSGASDICIVDIDCPRLQIYWVQIKGKITGSLSVGYNDVLGSARSHVFLEEQFRREGQYNDMNKCYYQRRLLEHKLIKTWYYKIIDLLLLVSCGYGVKPGWALIVGGIFIFLWSIIYFLFGVVDRKYNRLTDIFGHSLSYWSFIWNALFFSINNFIGIGFGDWHFKNQQSGKWYVIVFRFLVAFERVIGWLLLALFLVTLGRVWIR